MPIKSSCLTFGFIFSLTTIVFISPSQAFSINFSSWKQAGDVSTPSVGTADLSTNALKNDDFPSADSNFNFSNNPAIDSQNLELNLGLPPQSLDPAPNNLISAFEGSGLQQQYIFSEETIFSFNWTFLTNEQPSFDYNDYAFIALDGQIQTLANTNNSITLIPPNSGFSRGLSGMYTQTLSPGMYNIALGVVDVGSFDVTSALQVRNAQLSSQAVPEPISILGSLIALGFGGILKRKF